MSPLANVQGEDRSSAKTRRSTYAADASAACKHRDIKARAGSPDPTIGDKHSNTATGVSANSSKLVRRIAA